MPGQGVVLKDDWTLWRSFQRRLRLIERMWPGCLCSHCLLSPAGHRHLWEEPDPFRCCLHHQVPGPVHQLHLRLQHSHEGEGDGWLWGGCRLPPHRETVHMGTQAAEPDTPGLSWLCCHQLWARGLGKVSELWVAQFPPLRNEGTNIYLRGLCCEN